MSVQLRIVHSQWNDLRKAIHDTQRKFIVSDTLRSHNLTPVNLHDLEQDSTKSVLFLKDTSRSKPKSHLDRHQEKLLPQQAAAPAFLPQGPGIL